MSVNHPGGAAPWTRRSILGVTAAWIFLGLAVAETYDAHRVRLRQSWLSFVLQKPVGAAPLSRPCLDAHPSEPGICALGASERSAVEWLRAEFPPEGLPVIYSDDTATRIRMRYYARTPWMRRREAHCVLYSSENRDRRRAWSAGPRSVVAGANAVLVLPPSVADRDARSLDLPTAIEVCRHLPTSGVAAAVGPEEVLDLCRATPPGSDSRLEVLGLGGIRVDMVPQESQAGADAGLLARAFLVTAGTTIESFALLLKGPDGIERAHVGRPRTAVFSHELTHRFDLRGGNPPGNWVLTACIVDSEGFATTASTEARYP